MWYNKIISLICCLLMMFAAAICVNKSIGGHAVNQPETPTLQSTDTISRGDNGTITIHTASLCNEDGYAGKVPVNIQVDKDGNITDIAFLPNAETPSFFERASVIKNNWIGRNIADIEPQVVDAVSGATFSSNAIKANMEAGKNFYLKDASDSTSRKDLPLKMWIALGVVLAACIVPLFVKNKIYTNIQLIANIAVLGFWCGQFLDYSIMLKFISSGISLPMGLTAAIMLVAAFIYPLFGRPQYYCNHICPLGSAQILVGELCHYKIKLGIRTMKALNWFRKILWAALMLMLWGEVATEWMDYELFQAFLFESAPIAIIIIAVVFVLLSAVIARPYCRFVCPTGSLIKCAENLD